MIGQTKAIFIDAYRELNHRKLFWVCLGISALLVGLFASLGINSRGITVFGMSVGGEFNLSFITPALFYKFLFVAFGVEVWLTLGAMALALVSTASIFPEMVTAGSIELTLARPISRLRLFLTRYVASLIFVVMQVTVFISCAFMVIGLRGGAWLPGLFLAIPLVTLVFSFLFSVVVLVGVITRSAVTAIIAVVVLWFTITIVDGGETFLLQARVMNDGKLATAQIDADVRKVQIDRESEILAALPREAKAAKEIEIEALRRQYDLVNKSLDHLKNTASNLDSWHRGFFVVKTILPKSAEATRLLRNEIIDQAEMSTIFDFVDQQKMRNRRQPSADVMSRVDQELRKRTTTWAIGTSLAFEVVVVGLAAWIFCRRDF